jgi:nucleoside 2-deoxyribosyltransferase
MITVVLQGSDQLQGDMMGKPNLRDIAMSNLALLERKSADYSRDNIEATGIGGIAARMADKVFRLVNLTNKDGEPNFESIADTLQDIANYGVIGQAVAAGDWSRSTNFVYLAGPIDNLPESTATTWRRYVAERLCAGGVSSFDPSTAFHIGIKPPAEIVRAINRFALSQSHICLVNLTGETMGFGTLREIEFARAEGKRVIVAQNKGLECHLDAYDLELVRSLDEAIFRIIGDA